MKVAVYVSHLSHVSRRLGPRQGGVETSLEALCRPLVFDQLRTGQNQGRELVKSES